MALIGFRSPLTYHPWPWSEYTEAQKPGSTGSKSVIIGTKNEQVVGRNIFHRARP